MTTRNSKRAGYRRTIRISDKPVTEPQTDRQSRQSRKIHRDEIPDLMRHDTPQNRKVRQAWHQPGWTDVSPYWHNMTTIDSRWDK